MKNFFFLKKKFITEKFFSGNFPGKFFPGNFPFFVFTSYLETRGYQKSNKIITFFSDNEKTFSIQTIFGCFRSIDSFDKKKIQAKNERFLFQIPNECPVCDHRSSILFCFSGTQEKTMETKFIDDCSSK